MSQRLTIDPITRIEGHLRIDVEIDRGHVQKAWASSTMYRGIGYTSLHRERRAVRLSPLCRLARCPESGSCP